MPDSVVPMMEPAGYNIPLTLLRVPRICRRPRLQGAELFLGAQVERAVAPETVKKRGEAFDEGYEQRH